MKKDCMEEQISGQGYAGVYEINLSYYWRPVVLFFIFFLVAIMSIYMIFPYVQIMTAFISSCALGLSGIYIGLFWHSKVKKTSIPLLPMVCFMIIAGLVLYLNIPEFIQTTKNLNSIRTLKSDDIDQIMISISECA